MRGFAIAFVFVNVVFGTQKRSPEKTPNFVTFKELLTHPRVHHTCTCGMISLWSAIGLVVEAGCCLCS
jgi:hypothetical protein